MYLLVLWIRGCLVCWTCLNDTLRTKKGVLEVRAPSEFTMPQHTYHGSWKTTHSEVGEEQDQPPCRQTTSKNAWTCQLEGFTIAGKRMLLCCEPAKELAGAAGFSTGNRSEPTDTLPCGISMRVDACCARVWFFSSPRFFACVRAGMHIRRLTGVLDCCRGPGASLKHSDSSLQKENASGPGRTIQVAQKQALNSRVLACNQPSNS